MEFQLLHPSPSNEHPGLISFRMDWLDLLAVQGALKSLLQHHSSKASILRCSAFFMVQLSHPYMTTGKTMALTRWFALETNRDHTVSFASTTFQTLVDYGYSISSNSFSPILAHSSVQSLSHVQLFVTPWTAARQASLSITNSRSSPKLMPLS